MRHMLIINASDPTIIEDRRRKSQSYQRCYGRLDFKDGYPLQTLCSCMWDVVNEPMDDEETSDIKTGNSKLIWLMNSTGKIIS